MSDYLQDYYSDSKNVYSELGVARKGFGSTETTEDQWCQIEKTLGIMYLYCPEDLQTIVLATLTEANWRHAYAVTRNLS